MLFISCAGRRGGQQAGAAGRQGGKAQRERQGGKAARRSGLTPNCRVIRSHSALFVAYLPWTPPVVVSHKRLAETAAIFRRPGRGRGTASAGGERGQRLTLKALYLILTESYFCLYPPCCSSCIRPASARRGSTLRCRRRRWRDIQPRTRDTAGRVAAASARVWGLGLDWAHRPACAAAARRWRARAARRSSSPARRPAAPAERPSPPAPAAHRQNTGVSRHVAASVCARVGRSTSFCADRLWRWCSPVTAELNSSARLGHVRDRVDSTTADSTTAAWAEWGGDGTDGGRSRRRRRNRPSSRRACGLPSDGAGPLPLAPVAAWT